MCNNLKYNQPLLDQDCSMGVQDKGLIISTSSINTAAIWAKFRSPVLQSWVIEKHIFPRDCKQTLLSTARNSCSYPLGYLIFAAYSMKTKSGNHICPREREPRAPLFFSSLLWMSQHTFSVTLLLHLTPQDQALKKCLCLPTQLGCLLVPIPESLHSKCIRIKQLQ